MNALEVLRALVVDDQGTTWGARASEVQRSDAEAWLSGSEPNHFTTRARGYSKTEDLAGAILAALVAGPGLQRGCWLAADLGQGRLALDTIGQLVRRTAALKSLVTLTSSRVEVANGSTLEILPADVSGSWGLRPDFIGIDELAAWADTPSSRALLDAMLSAAPKIAGCRVVAITSAGEPHGIAWELRQHALGSDRWRVSETRGPAPWQDPEALDDERRRLPAGRFAQLFMNDWTTVAGDFLDVAAVDVCFTAAAPLLAADKVGSFVAALDIGLVRDRTAFAVVRRHGGMERLALMKCWEGRKGSEVQLQEVAAYVEDVARMFGAEVLLDPWQSAAVRQHLDGRGVRTREFIFNQASKERLASTLLDAITSRRLELYEPGGLRDELVRLRVKPTGAGRFAFDHLPGQHDDRAVALAMALARIAEKGEMSIGRVPWGDMASHERFQVPSTPGALKLGLHGRQYVDQKPRGGR